MIKRRGETLILINQLHTYYLLQTTYSYIPTYNIHIHTYKTYSYSYVILSSLYQPKPLLNIAFSQKLPQQIIRFARIHPATLTRSSVHHAIGLLASLAVRDNTRELVNSSGKTLQIQS